MNMTSGGRSAISHSADPQRHGRTTLCLHHRNQQLWLEPDVPEIGDFLLTRRAKIASLPDGIGIEWRLCPLVGRTGDGVRNSRCDFPNAGLHEVVTRLLEQRKFSVGNSLASIPLLPPPSSFKIQGRSSADLDVLDAVRRRSHTLVHFQTGVDRDWLIAQLALAYPNLRIAVACASRRQVESISREFAWCRIDHRVALRGKPCDSEAPVVVGTFYGLCDAECEKRDLVIVPDAKHVLNDRAKNFLMQADSRWRLVGLLRADAMISQEERDQITAAFGVVFVEVRRHGRETAPPNVLPLTHHQHDAGQQAGEVQGPPDSRAIER